MKQSLIQLHISVLLAGFTGVLGVLIQLNELPLVWYRMGITFITLLLILIIQKQKLELGFRKIMLLLSIGILIALHWVFFYASIKFANVSIGLVCFAATSLFTALLEPLLNSTPWRKAELLLGILSLLGIYIIFQFDIRYRTGILFGLGSAIIAALFSVLNKKNIATAPPQTIMLFEMGGGFLFLTCLLPAYIVHFPDAKWIPSLTDVFWLLILAWFCTVLAMELMLKALHNVSAFTQNLTLNLEPVYGILLAFLVFHENRYLQNTFYVGMACIALSVGIQMRRIVNGRSY
ncbi:MAG: EamA family transporter [Sphingobacteriales bacterium]|uniref:DMT family transporter n=1 Tax=Hydrotalea flava TaxID=714549 RepID=UPI000834863C|nr:DMT family transporter [Hydrotalea flava]RTL48263.1 MAG: EamA family transporter [Sphingobacteriales bacterium]